ncbi:hypothetical protein [Dokdonia sp.]
MTTEEITRLEELKIAIQICPDGCAIPILGIPVLEEFIALLIKEKEE